MPPPVLDIPALVSSADLVVVARLDPAKPQAEILQLIKGTLPTNVPSLRARLAATNGTGMVRTLFFFMRHAGTGEVTFAKDDRAIVSSPTPFPQTPLPADPLGKTTSFLAALLTMPPSVVTQPEQGLTAFRLEAGTGDAHAAEEMELAEHVYAETTEALRVIPVEVKHNFLLAAADGNPKAANTLYAQAALLEAGDGSRISHILPSLLDPVKGADRAYAKLFQAIEQNGLPPDAEPFLVSLISSRNVFARRAAAYKLRGCSYGPATFVQSRKALERALLDPDRDVRGYAASGLCWDLQLCTGAAAISRYAQPENAPQLVQMVAGWEINHAALKEHPQARKGRRGDVPPPNPHLQ